MDYYNSYKNTVSLADTLLQSVRETKDKGKSGLGSRQIGKQRESMSENIADIQAQYINDIRNMFADSLPSREQSTSEIENYLAFKDGSPMAKRNPSYWEDAPLLAPISAAETDENVRAILETLKAKESSGDYSVKNKKSSASGGYQMIDSTWQSLTKKYGIGTEYKTAKDAPPEVQDMVASNYVREILIENDNDVTKVPVVWYTGNAKGEMSEKALAANDGLTAQQYQSDWMRRYNKMLGN
jgi:hypothetical protein